MDDFAILLGRSVLAMGSVALLVCGYMVVFRQIWRAAVATMNLLDMQEAIVEWKQRHPEKWAESQRRNDV